MILPTRFDPETSFAIERVATRGWPAEEVEVVEGWSLRRTDGVDRRRSNSLLPPPDSGHAVRTIELALATAEELGVPAVVQVSPAEAHLMLDEALEARGMAWSGPSLVLAGEVRSVVVREAAVTVELGVLTPEWVAAWSAVSGIDGAAETAEAVLSQLAGRARFAIARDVTSAEPVGTAVGVVDDGWLGLFSLAVLPARRRYGVGTAIVDALEAWARATGARRIYLQVEADNDIALAFYAVRGFHIAHSYHYRSE
jgi:GNAT superfamily N-acetyltransferase